MQRVSTPVGRPRLAPRLRKGKLLTDALDLGRVQRRSWGRLAMVLKAHPHREAEQFGKALAHCPGAGDLATDVADHPAESGV
jgi:hypothetical protein